MRKHKSVVAILLAVMMIFTFMPTMAFADTPAQYSNYNAVWSSDYSKVTVTVGTGASAKTETYNANITFQSSTGQKYALAYDTDKSADKSFAALNISAPYAYFYDLDGAILYKGNSAYTIRDYSRAAFEKDYPQTGSVGAYTLGVKDPTDTTAPYTYVKANMVGYKVSFEPEKVFDYTSTAAQNISVPVSVDFNTSVATSTFDPTNSAGFIEAINVDKVTTPINLTVGAKTTVPSQAQFRFVGKTTPLTTPYTNLSMSYTGTAQTIEMVPTEGLSVKWQKVVNGSYVDTDAISVTNVGDVVNGRAIVSKSGSADAYFAFNLKVTKNISNTPIISFSTDYDGYVDDPASKSQKLPYFAVSEGYDPADKLAVKPHSDSENDKAAASANEEKLLAFVKDFYEFKKETKAAYPDYEFVSTVKKDLSKATAEERSAIVDKYYQMLRNFSTYSATAKVSASESGWKNFCLAMTNTFTVSGLKNVAFTTNAATLDNKVDDITFTGVTTKAFKAKKKTKKLAKTKSFQVAATADSGNTITFSGTSSNAKVSIDATGKVTVKKGLKKGSKVKLEVKAKTAAGNGYKACIASKTYTIKVK